MFPGLTLNDLPGEVQLEVNTLIAEYFQSSSAKQSDQIEDKIASYLLPYRFYWKEFNYWQKEFQEKGHFPYLWLSLKKETSGPDYVALLDTLSQLNFKSRLLLVRSGSLYRTTDKVYDINNLKQQSTLSSTEFTSSIKELETHQLLFQETTPEEFLNCLNLDSLQVLAHQQSSHKTHLIQIILQDKELLQQIPKELVRITAPKLTESGNIALKYHLQKLDLLRQTMITTKRNIAKKEQLLEQGLYVVEIVGKSSCSICTDRQGQVLRLNSSKTLLPPFHPGCTCGFEPTDRQMEVKVHESIVDSFETEKRGCASYLFPTFIVDMIKKG